MREDHDLEERLFAASGAEESPVDREEHASRVAAVVNRVRGLRAAGITDDLLERVRAARGEL